MKRLTWILLAAFCFAFGRVQPVEPVSPKLCVCRHCANCSDCSMPCSRAQAATPGTFDLQTQARVSRPAADSQLRLERLIQIKFYAPFATLPAVAALDVRATPMPAAGALLFRAHCSFLI
jgi:hypothetical protein